MNYWNVSDHELDAAEARGDVEAQRMAAVRNASIARLERADQERARRYEKARRDLDARIKAANALLKANGFDFVVDEDDAYQRLQDI